MNHSNPTLTIKNEKRIATNNYRYGTNEVMQSEQIKRKSIFIRTVNILCKISNKYYLMNPKVRINKIKDCIEKITKNNNKHEILYAIKKIQEKIDIYSQKNSPNPAKIYISTKKLLKEALNS